MHPIPLHQTPHSLPRMHRPKLPPSLMKMRHPHLIIIPTLPSNILPLYPLIRILLRSDHLDRPILYPTIQSLGHIPTRFMPHQPLEVDKGSLKRTGSSRLGGIIMTYIWPPCHSPQCTLGTQIHNGMTRTGRKPILGRYPQHFQWEPCIILRCYRIHVKLVGATVHITVNTTILPNHKVPPHICLGGTSGNTRHDLLQLGEFHPGTLVDEFVNGGIVVDVDAVFGSDSIFP
mmetsp:Transcript_18077/g.28357  ORF Transcript_18077/g.28357 Transcript_18077/m.28357 type:complete len:231 (-) Transcript_18077:497-1189(-)